MDAIKAEGERVRAMPAGPEKDAAMDALLTMMFQHHQASGQGGRRHGRKTLKGRKGRKRTMRKY